MRVLRNARTTAELELSQNELLIINNALNEICNGLSIPDFHPRIGAERHEAAKLLEEVGRALDSLKSP